jgi:hypothetical protein
MERGRRPGRTGISMRASGRKTCTMVMGKLPGMMGRFTQGSIDRDRRMALGSTTGMTNRHISEAGMITKCTDKERTTGRMEGAI